MGPCVRVGNARIATCPNQHKNTPVWSHSQSCCLTMLAGKSARGHAAPPPRRGADGAVGGPPPCILCGSCEVAPCCSACSRLTSKWKRVDIPILINKHRRVQAENAALQQAIEQRLSAQMRYRELLHRKEVLLLRLRRTRELITKQSSSLDKESKRVRSKRQQVQANLKQLKQAIHNLESNKNSLYNDSLYKSGLLEQRKELAILRTRLSDKRKERIFELLSILPVLPVNDQQCRIINIVLPNNGDYSVVESHVLAAALGYIVHIVRLIASYLGVVLPFRMESRGSQSYIYREGSATKYPLFLESNECELWLAITALHINVAYLCATQGFLPNKTQIPQILLNLRRLLQSPDLGSDIPSRQPSAREAAEKKDLLGDWELI